MDQMVAFGGGEDEFARLEGWGRGNVDAVVRHGEQQRGSSLGAHPKRGEAAFRKPRRGPPLPANQTINQ